VKNPQKRGSLGSEKREKGGSEFNFIAIYMFDVKRKAVGRAGVAGPSQGHLLLRQQPLVFSLELSKLTILGIQT